MSGKHKNTAREWFDTLFYGVLIAIVFRSLLLEPFPYLDNVEYSFSGRAST